MLLNFFLRGYVKSVIFGCTGQWTWWNRITTAAIIIIPEKKRSVWDETEFWLGM
jgi:hypothetical protein